MKPTPPGWPRISSAVWYQDPAKAIDWLCNAFGFEVRLKVEAADGSIAHSELVFGEGVIMVGGKKQDYRQSPRAIGGANTQSMMVYVDDVEAHFKRAREAGAKIVSELATADHGAEYWSDRGYEAEDLDGHHWWFFQRLRDPIAK
ncbi:MAG: VOC family protein [Acidobacteriota bacterium]